MKTKTLFVYLLVFSLSITACTSFALEGTRDSSRVRDLYNNGATLYFNGDFSNAAIVLDSAVRLDSTFVNAYNILGLSYLKLHQWRDAERVLRHAIALDSHYAFAYFNLGVALSSNPLAGDKQEIEAIQLWQKSAELESDPAQILKIRVEIGNALKMRADISGAINEYRNALHLDSTYLPALIELATAYRDLGDLKGSDSLMRRIFELDSMFVPALNASGDMLLVDNQLLSALQIYFRSIELDSTRCRSYRIVYNTLNVLIDNIAHYRTSAYVRGEIIEWRKEGQFRPWPKLQWATSQLDSLASVSIDRHNKKYILKQRSCNDSLFMAGYLRSKFSELKAAIMVQDDNSAPFYRCAEFYDVILHALREKRSQISAKASRILPNCFLSEFLNSKDGSPEIPRIQTNK
jgi:Tfp pilus assembly protein PilF